MNRRPATCLALAGLTFATTCTRSVQPDQPPVVVAIPVYNPPPATAPPARAQPPAAQPSTAPASSGTPGVPSRARDVSASIGVRDVGGETIRVLLTANATSVQIGASGVIAFSDREGRFLARGTQTRGWRVERSGRRLRVVRSDGVASSWAEGALVAQSGDAGLLSVGAKPYRGNIIVYPSDSGMRVVNVVSIDDYLRGVVPLEIGTRSMGDSAAVQAQAVTARSYAYIHLAPNSSRDYDVTAGTQDQVYGGAAVESEVGSRAVESTRALVLKYAGRIVNAPYSSTCGGATAGAGEIWRSEDEPYLRRVSDEIPGTGRYYCDIAPRFRWSRTLSAQQLNAGLAQYLARYVSVPGKAPGVAQSIVVGSRTTSGRVGTLVVTTDRGRFTLRGNDVRYVLRQPGGEILNSTYFSVVATPGSDGTIAKLTLTGNGYGHGVGMCQWGAIGRARAGQDFRTILRTYYPGTTVGTPE